MIEDEVLTGSDPNVELEINDEVALDYNTINDSFSTVEPIYHFSTFSKKYCENFFEHKLLQQHTILFVKIKKNIFQNK